MTTITIDRSVVEQALEALDAATSYIDGYYVPRGKTTLPEIEEAQKALRAALAQQDELVQEQDVEDAIEAAYWHFDARKKGLNEWAYAPQSERDAFKAEARKLVRGYFPTRQAQDTKREMLAVADAFIRGKRAALAQQEEPVQQRELLIQAASMAVAAERAGKYGGASWVADALLDALAQQAEPVEPVAWLQPKNVDGYSRPDLGYETCSRGDYGAFPVYTAPPQRLPLTDEEILKAIGWERAEMYMKLTPNFPVAEAKKETLKNARAIERAHGIGEAK